MAIVSFKQSGDFRKTIKFLNAVSGGDYIEKVLKHYGEVGLAALKEATPVDTGKTRDSWSYQIYHDDSTVKIEWDNNNMAGKSNVPIVVLLQYGHASKNKGWVEGRDFINPAIQPVFDKIAEQVWKEVTSA